MSERDEKRGKPPSTPDPGEGCSGGRSRVTKLQAPTCGCADGTRPRAGTSERGPTLGTLGGQPCLLLCLHEQRKAFLPRSCPCAPWGQGVREGLADPESQRAPPPEDKLTSTATKSHAPLTLHNPWTQTSVNRNNTHRDREKTLNLRRSPESRLTPHLRETSTLKKKLPMELKKELTLEK